MALSAAAVLVPVYQLSCKPRKVDPRLHASPAVMLFHQLSAKFTPFANDFEISLGSGHWSCPARFVEHLATLLLSS